MRTLSARGWSQIVGILVEDARKITSSRNAKILTNNLAGDGNRTGNANLGRNRKV